MVEPFIKHVVDGTKEFIDNIIFIATDQEDDEFKNDDTLYFAEITKKFLFEQNKEKKKSGNNFLKDINIIKLNGNVADLGEMNRSINKIMKCNKNFKNLHLEHTKVYVCNVGGIDAINVSILVNSITKFKDKCIQLYIDKKSHVVYPLDFISELLLDVDKSKLKFYIKNYDYFSCSEIIKEQVKLKKYDVLIQIAKDRLSFNFDKIKEISSKYLENGIENQDIINEVRKNLIEVTQMSEDNLSKIKELYINCRIKYIQEQYVDFLLRIFRLEESLNRYIIEKYLHFNTEKVRHNDFKELTDNIKQNKCLENYLNSYKINGTKLNWENDCNNKILFAILNFIIDENKTVNNAKLIADESSLRIIKNVYDLNNVLNELSELRNKSIGAHGFQGVSKVKIDSVLDEFHIKIDDLFNYIEQSINVKFEDCCYERMNNLILSNL